MENKYDWKNIEKYYIEKGQDSSVTLKVISEHFGIPYQSVRRYAAANRWSTKRLIRWCADQGQVEAVEMLQKYLSR